MTTINSFGFGRLIKTLIPGLVLLSGLVVSIDLAFQGSGKAAPLTSFIVATPVVATAAAIPAAVMLGIFSNIVVFGWATTRLIRVPFSRKHPDLERAEESLKVRVLEQKRAREYTGNNLGDEGFDLDYLLVFDWTVDRVAHLQDSYWYYLEFQLNTALALIFVSPVGLVVTYLGADELGYGWPSNAGLLVLVAATIAGIVGMLVKGARTNYDRHRRKRLSMLVAAYGRASATPPTPPGARPPRRASLVSMLRRSS